MFKFYRGIYFSGYSGSYTNVIEYIQIATAGNAVDFGDPIIKQSMSGPPVSSPTRAVNMGGFNSPAATNVIEYVEIATYECS